MWVLSWIFLLMILSGLALGLSARLSALTSQIPPALLSGAGVVLLTLLQGAVLNYIGDAARYLSPMPKNIKLRQEIRSDGIRLLKRIQEEGEYDRVILVGHSLGSVIAYDILRYSWPECAADYRLAVRSSQPALAKVEAAGEKLRQSPGEESLEAYRIAQVDMWKENMRAGEPLAGHRSYNIGKPIGTCCLVAGK